MAQLGDNCHEPENPTLTTIAHPEQTKASSSNKKITTYSDDISNCKRVTIFQNGKYGSGGKVLFVPKTLKKLITVAAKKLNIDVKRVFNKEGGEIEDIDEILPNDVLYFSLGEEFIQPKLQVDAKGKPYYVTKGDWVTLNVGGKIFATTRSTLTKDTKSMLSQMFSGEWESFKDMNGCILIDRSPEYFAPLLNFLRSEQLIIDPGVSPAGVMEEAKFFGLNNVVEHLKYIVELNTRSESITRKDIVSVLLNSSTLDSLRCQGLNLSGIDLSKLDLRKINFRMTNFTGANLEAANLDDTILQDSILVRANLERANLRGVNLSGANLEDATLQGANFEDRNGVRSNLEGVNLKKANLSDAILSGVNLRAANLKGANLENANLRYADLAACNLEDANLKGANLTNTNLRGANLQGAKLDERAVSSHFV